MAALIQEAIDCVPTALTIFDENLLPLLANKASYELDEVMHNAMKAGKTYREATFQSIKAADPQLCDDECWQLADMLEALFRTGDTVEVSHSGGRIFRTSYTQMSGNRHVSVASDITELRRREEELIQSQQQAEAANSSKSSFLANMSHEIRTPLNGILGMAQLLVESGLTPAQMELAEIVLESGKSLKSLLDDILDLSKIEAGRMELAPVDADFRQLLRRQQRLWMPRAEEKGLVLTLAIDAAVPALLRFDAERLGQCIANIVSNAIKFTERGEVGISASCQPLPDGVAISITVRDTGIGMNEATAHRLFAPFTQADSTISRRFGGTGLGLVITRRLARLMHGDLTVESQEGVGSTFSLTFIAQPVSALAAAGADQPATPVAPLIFSLRGKKLLLVDDHPLNRRVGRLFLEPEGVLVTEAVNGLEALEKLAAEHFDLVLLDIHMPVLDGIETLRRLRQSTEPWRDIPVIALTADAMSGDRERYLAEGMNGYISKPIDKVALLMEIQKLLGGDSSLAALPGAAAVLQKPVREDGAETPLSEQELTRLLAEMDGTSQPSTAS